MYNIKHVKQNRSLLLCNVVVHKAPFLNDLEHETEYKKTEIYLHHTIKQNM